MSGGSLLMLVLGLVVASFTTVIAIAAAFLWFRPPMEKEIFPSLFDKLFSFLDSIGVSLGFGADEDDDSSKHVEVQLFSNEAFIRLTNVRLFKPVVIPINDNLSIQLHASIETLCVSWNWLTDFQKAIHHSDCYIQNPHATISGLDATVTFVPWRMKTRLPLGESSATGIEKPIEVEPKPKKKSAIMAIVWDQLHLLFNALKITLDDWKVNVTSVTSNDTTLLEYEKSQCASKTLEIGAKQLREERKKGQPKTGSSTERTWNFVLDQFYMNVISHGIPLTPRDSTRRWGTVQFAQTPLLKTMSLRADWTMRPSEKFRHFWSNDGLRMVFIGYDDDCIVESDPELLPLYTTNQLNAQKDEVCLVFGETQLDCVNQHVGVLLLGILGNVQMEPDIQQAVTPVLSNNTKPIKAIDQNHTRKPVSLTIKHLSAASAVLPNGEKLSMAGLRLDIQFDGSEFVLQGRRGVFLSNDETTTALISLPTGCRWIGDHVNKEFLVFCEQDEKEVESQTAVVSVQLDQKAIHPLQSGFAELAKIFKLNLNKGALGVLWQQTSRDREAHKQSREGEVVGYWDYHVHGSLSVLYRNDMGNKKNPIVVETRLHSIHVVWDGMKKEILATLGEIDNFHVHGQVSLIQPIQDITLSCDCSTHEAGGIWKVNLSIGPIIAKLLPPPLEQHIRDSEKKREMEAKGETIFSPVAPLHPEKSSSESSTNVMVEGEKEKTHLALRNFIFPGTAKADSPKSNSEAQSAASTNSEATKHMAGPSQRVDSAEALRRIFPFRANAESYSLKPNEATEALRAERQAEAKPPLIVLPFTAIVHIDQIQIYGVDGETEHINVEDGCIAVGPDASVEDYTNQDGSTERVVTPTGGMRLALAVKKVEHCMVGLGEAVSSAIILPHDLNTVERFEFRALAIRITSGYSIFAWKRLGESGDQNREKRHFSHPSKKKKKTSPLRIPFAHICPLKVKVHVKGEVGLKGATVHFREFHGKENTTINDLIPLYVAGVLESFPELFKDSEFLGLNLTDGIAAGFNAALPGTGFAGFVAYDAARNLVEAGKRERGASEDDKRKAGDFFRGIGQVTKEAKDRGATIRGRLPGSPEYAMEGTLDWAVGAGADIGDYAKHNKSRIAAQGGAVAGAAAGFVVGGPIGALVGAVIGYRVTHKAVSSVDEILAAREQTKADKIAILENAKPPSLVQLEKAKAEEMALLEKQ